MQKSAKKAKIFEKLKYFKIVVKNLLISRYKNKKMYLNKVVKKLFKKSEL